MRSSSPISSGIVDLHSTHDRDGSDSAVSFLAGSVATAQTTGKIAGVVTDA
jgi:hypothetical protein